MDKTLSGWEIITIQAWLPKFHLLTKKLTSTSSQHSFLKATARQPHLLQIQMESSGMPPLAEPSNGGLLCEVDIWEVWNTEDIGSEIWEVRPLAWSSRSILMFHELFNDLQIGFLKWSLLEFVIVSVMPLWIVGQFFDDKGRHGTGNLLFDQQFLAYFSAHFNFKLHPSWIHRWIRDWCEIRFIFLKTGPWWHLFKPFMCVLG